MTDKFPFEIIDSHLHVFDLKLRSSFPNQNPSHSFPSATDPGEAPIAYDVTQALAEQVAGANGVRNVIFVMCYNDCPEEARWVYEVAQSHQLIKGIVAGLDLTNHDKLLKCIDEFRSSFRGPKFVGVRHHIVSNEDLLMRDDFQKGLGILEEKGVPFDLGINDTIIKHIPTIASKFPNLKMVIDHLAKPEVPKGNEYLENWKKEITEAAKHPNVHMKLSGLVMLADPWTKEAFQPYVDHCIEAFGVKRCMFGSDWPVCRVPKNTDYGDVLQLLKDLVSNLSIDEKKSIFHDTVMSYYGLDENCISK